MKKVIVLIGLMFFCGWTNFSVAQEETGVVEKKEKYSKIIKNDGTEYVGVILSIDAREVLIRTDDLGEIIIPKHEIKSILELEEGETHVAEVEGRNLLASRYTISTNGFPVKKGEGYVRFMPVGLDMQFAVTDNWSIGGMTSWIGVPMIVTSKLSANLADNVNGSVGFLYGNLMYGGLFSGGGSFSSGGGIGFGNLTFGTEQRNFNIGGGYGFVHYTRSEWDPMTGFRNDVQEVNGTGMFSVGGMYQIGEQATLLFDGMGLITQGDLLFWFNPAVRYMPRPDHIWQFGINVVGANTEVFPLPIPSISFTKVFLKR